MNQVGSLVDQSCRASDHDLVFGAIHSKLDRGAWRGQLKTRETSNQLIAARQAWPKHPRRKLLETLDVRETQVDSADGRLRSRMLAKRASAFTPEVRARNRQRLKVRHVRGRIARWTGRARQSIGRAYARHGEYADRL